LIDFLDEEDHAAILDWALSAKERFYPALVHKIGMGQSSEADPKQRIASTTSDLGPIESMVSNRLDRARETLAAATGTPVPPGPLELELAAHGDGAFFTPHTDIPVGKGRAPHSSKEGYDRILSAVYYFGRRPIGFSGGALRLYRFGTAPGDRDDPSTFVDIEPIPNSLVAFPSIALHEVRRVNCPTGDWRDHRFAINCWYLRDAVRS
jgi:Rps23 Pro-64 3,4-dihydroxylase Tpa1-like proline 4-hydroxylase